MMALEWTVPDLLQYKQEGFSFQEKVALPLELFRVDPEIRHLSQLEVKGFVEFSKQSLTFHLWIEGTMVLPCALTLKDVDYPFHIHTSETFLLNASADINEADNEWVHEIEDDRIDLVPYIVEAILVEKPMRVVSEEAKAESNNLPSGEGWEFVTEENRKREIDPRLEKLKKFFDE